MNELELLVLRLEDLSEAATNIEVKTLAKALLRYFLRKSRPTGFGEPEANK